MKDNLPEIKVKGYKDTEKKGGFLGSLFRGAGGAGASGGAASTGIGALVAGNLGTIAAVVVAAGIGLSVVADKAAKNAPAGSQAQLGEVAAGKKASTQPEEYVPAIQRAEQANNASSLAMFTDTNKGSGLQLADGSAPKAAQQEGAKTEEAKDGSAEAPQDGSADGEGMAEGMMAGMDGQQGGLSGNSLSSSLGGGSGKSIRLGNKAGTLGGGLSSNVGSGFKAMPKFNERKGKLLAMRGASRPVTSAAGSGGKGSKFSDGRKSWKQARGLWSTQKKAATATTTDGARSTADKAWEGSTGTGEAEGGEGMSEEGIVTSPSLDNPSTGGGGGNIPAGDYNWEDPCGCDINAGQDAYKECVKNSSCNEDVSPWASTATACNILILAAVALAAIGGAFVRAGQSASTTGIGAVFGGEAALIIGYVICGIAIACAAVALGLAIYLGVEYKQGWMAGIYGLGAGLAGLAGAMGLTGSIEKAIGFSSGWVAGAAMICSSIAGALAK